jgi:uncharacterized protein (DUF488 family)
VSRGDGSAFTIGYGGRKPEELTRALADHGVRTVVDVRLRPDRASVGAYARAREADRGIAGLLARAGLGYVALPELGNLFLEDPDWAQRYERLLALAGPLLFDRLEGLPQPVCLMCAERDVTDCHRRHLAAHLQRAKGWAFTHIE